MQSSGGMATVEAATQRPVNLLMSGPGRRPDRRHLGGQDGRLRERRHARHGRHLGRHRRRRGRAAAHAPPARHEGRRLPGDGADGRHRHDRRRRRLDRLRRRGRRLPRRPAVGGRRSRPGLLRPRRRRSRPRPTRSSCSGGCARTAACSAATCRSTSTSRAAAMQRVADRLGMSVEEAALGALQIQKFGDGAGDRAELGAPRLRPARVHARRRRRRRPAVRLRHRARARDPARARPAAPGHHVGDRPARDRPPARVRRHRAPLAEDASTASGSARASTSSSRRPSRSSSADGVPGGPAARAPPRRLPLRGPGLRGALRRARPATIDDALGRASWRRRFHRAHEREYGHRFDAEIEIVNVRARRHRARSPSSSGPSSRRGDGDPSRRADGRARGRLRRRAASPSAAPTPFYDRELLRAGDRIEGPAVIEQYDSTTVVPPGLVAEIDRYGNIVIDCRAARAHGASAAPAWRRRSCMRVIGGAFSAIAKEMAGVLYRMSLLVDHPRVRGPRRRHLRRRGQRAGRVGLDADVHGRDAEDRQGRDHAPRRRHPRGRRHPPQRPLPRRHALARRRDRGADLLRGRAGRLLRRLGAPARHRRRLPRPRRSTSSTTGRRGTSTARSSSPSRACARTSSGSTSSRTRARRRTTAATSRR